MAKVATLTKLINPTSFVVFKSQLVEVVNTGGWYDVYLQGQHYTGTMHLHEAAKIFQAFDMK